MEEITVKLVNAEAVRLNLDPNDKLLIRTDEELSPSEVCRIRAAITSEFSVRCLIVHKAFEFSVLPNPEG